MTGSTETSDSVELSGRLRTQEAIFRAETFWFGGVMLRGSEAFHAQLDHPELLTLESNVENVADGESRRMLAFREFPDGTWDISFDGV